MRKSQVSLFIVLGFIILVLAALGIYFYFFSAERAIQDELFRTYDDLIPSDLLPFKRYVDQCLDDVLLQAVRRAGAQGGLVYPLESGLQFNYVNPTESDGVALFSGGDLNIPYWVYIAGDNECLSGCEKVYAAPPLEGDSLRSVSSQIATYIERNIDRCIRNREQLTSVGIYYERAGVPKAEVILAADSVVASLTYPFDLEYGESGARVDRFFGRVNVPFVQFYEDALFLSTLIDDLQLFEHVTLNLISLYSEMDGSSLPPKSGTDLEYVSTVFWISELVTQKLKQLLISNIPYFRVEGTRNFRRIDTFYDTDFYELKLQQFNEFIIPSPDHFSRYSIDFKYAGWNPYVRLNDGSQVLRPESVRLSWFPWFGVNRIRTLYSVSYPVVITFTDPDVLNGDGFSFSFAMETNIRNNLPMNETHEPFDYSAFEGFQSSRTFLCDPDMRTSEPVSFRVINGLTGQPEEGVALSFICGDDVCPIGRTSESGTFAGSLPICAGGRMEFLKPEFETLYVRINPSIEHDIILGDIPFEPFRYKNISFSKIVYSKLLDDIWAPGGIRAPASDERILLYLERTDLPSHILEREDFSSFVVLEPGQSSVEMQLLPGRYSGQIVSLKTTPFTIEPREECVDARVLGGLFGSRECFMIPEEPLVLEESSLGLAEFNENNLPLIIRKEDLDRSNTIELRYIFIDLPNANPLIVEDLEQLGMFEEYIQVHRRSLGPIYR